MIKIYLASPYSDPDEKVRLQRFHNANRQAGRLMLHGHIVFSPISHSHPIALTMDPERVCDHDLWMKQDIPFLEWADQLWIMAVDGWNTSRGVRREIDKAEELSMPIKWI